MNERVRRQLIRAAGVTLAVLFVVSVVWDTFWGDSPLWRKSSSVRTQIVAIEAFMDALDAIGVMLPPDGPFEVAKRNSEVWQISS